MTRDEVVTIIQQTLGFRTDLTDAIVRNLKLAQTTLELGPTKPWFLISEDSYTFTTVGAHRVVLPTDFLMEYEEGTLYYVPDDAEQEEVILGKRDYDDLFKMFAGVVDATTISEPQYYALRGKYFMIFPRPDDDYRIRMVYHKRDAELDSDIENEWLKHVPLLLAGMAGKLLAPGLRDGNATAVFADWERAGRVSLFNRNEDRQHVGRDDYQMGGPE